MKGEGWLTFLVALIIIGALVSAKGASDSSAQPVAPVVQTVSGR